MKKFLSRLMIDSGSIAPLAIGLFVFSVAMMFTVISASSMFILQKRLTTFAEAAAVYVSSGGESSEVFVETVSRRSFANLRIEDRLLRDGLTTEVFACASWLPPIVVLEPLVSKEICSHATARAGG